MRWRDFHQRWWGRLSTAIVLVSCTLLVYQTLNYQLSPKYDFWTEWDAKIPFLPATVVIYLSLYPLFLVAAISVRGLRFERMMARLLLASGICHLGFVFWTAHYPRPPASAWQNSFFAPIFDALMSADPPGNTFPSLHVTMATLLAVALFRTPGQIVWVLWSFAIGISTMTVKQHFIWDWAAGVVVALSVHLFMSYWEARVDFVEVAEKERRRWRDSNPR